MVRLLARTSLRSVCGPKPAAVRFKAAFRAARRPVEPFSARWARVPREGWSALLGRKPTLLDLALPDPEAPVFPPVLSGPRPKGGPSKEPVPAFGGTPGKEIP